MEDCLWSPEISHNIWGTWDISAPSAVMAAVTACSLKHAYSVHQVLANGVASQYGMGARNNTKVLDVMRRKTRLVVLYVSEE